MKNKLTDLNDHLFAALERLNDEELTSDNLAIEVERAQAITGIADKIIANAKVSLDAMKLISHGDISAKDLPNTFQKQIQA